MKSVHLNSQVETWVPAAEGFAELTVTDVPDDLPLAEVVRIANGTGINMPAGRQPKPVSVGWGTLGKGRFVNLAA